MITRLFSLLAAQFLLACTPSAPQPHTSTFEVGQLDSKVDSLINFSDPTSEFEWTIFEDTSKFNGPWGQNQNPVADLLQHKGFFETHGSAGLNPNGRFIFKTLQNGKWICRLLKEYTGDELLSYSTQVSVVPASTDSSALSMDEISQRQQILERMDLTGKLPFEVELKGNTLLRYEWEDREGNLELVGEAYLNGQYQGNFLRTQMLDLSRRIGWIYLDGEKAFTYAYPISGSGNPVETVTFIKEDRGPYLDTLATGFYIDTASTEGYVLVGNYDASHGTTIQLINVETGTIQNVEGITEDACGSQIGGIRSCVGILEVNDENVIIGNSEPIVSIRRSEI